MSVARFTNSLLATGLVGVSVLGVIGCASSTVGTATTAERGSVEPGTGPTLARGLPYRLEGDPPYVKRIHTGSRPCATLGAAGAIWVADLADNRVTRLDPETGRVTARVRTDAGPCGMAFGANSVWVEDYGADAVTRIMLPGLETRRYPVGGSPYDVTFAAGAAWTTDYADGTVTRIDASTGKTQTIKVGLNPVGIAPAAGAVWVANSSSGTVSRIDDTTSAVTTVKVGGAPMWTAYAGDTVWVGDAASGQVIRIDAKNGRIVARVKVGPTPNDGDVYAGYVWFPDKNGALYRIDERTNRVSAPFPLGAANPFVVSGYGDRLWVADFGGTDTFVVDPGALPETAGGQTR
jgi:YVTN family beta-propeller protein